MQSLLIRGDGLVDREQLEAHAEVFRENAGVVDRSLRRIRAGHADADHVFRADGVGSDGGSERRIDSAAETDDGFLKSALPHVVARAQDQRSIHAGFLTFDLLVQVASQGLGIEVDQVFFEGTALRDDVAFRVENDAGAVKDQAVVASDLIDQRDRNFMMARDGGQHVAAQFALADPKGRRGNVEHEVPTGSDQRLDGIGRVQALGPEQLVVPCVFADGERHAVAAEGEQVLALGGREVAHLVEDVVCGQEHLRLQECDFAVQQQRSGIHRGLAGLGFGGSY